VMEMKVGSSLKRMLLPVGVNVSPPPTLRHIVTFMLFGLVEVCHHLCLNSKFVYVSPLISHSQCK
jgi:hypothetical protein